MRPSPGGSWFAAPVIALMTVTDQALWGRVSRDCWMPSLIILARRFRRPGRSQGQAVP